MWYLWQVVQPIWKPKKHLLRHSGEKPHKCKICEKTFAVAGNFKTHLLIHSGEKLHKCETYGKAFHQRYQLKEHIVLHN